MLRSPTAGLLGCVAALLLVPACGAADADEPQHPNPHHESHKGNTAEVLEGGPLYVANCAECHGPAGRGTDTVPAVVGDDALPLNPGPKSKKRTAQFTTAKDVFDFIKVNMPADEPGSMSDDQYYAILAFALKLNGVNLTDHKVDPTTAPLIKLPGR
jgi:cytochrome c